ncbi:hypothetical protein Tco_0847438 [Tanacetum coccineum]
MPHCDTPNKAEIHARKDDKPTHIDPSLTNLTELVYDGSYENLVQLLIKTILEAPLKDTFLMVVLDDRVKAIIQISNVYCVGFVIDEKEVLEFGVAKEKKPRLFANSNLLGFKENYGYFVGDKVLVGNGNFKKAIGHISRTLIADTRACKTHVGTVIICLCEAARFRPIFAEFKKDDWGVLIGWMWTLIQNWEKISEVARRPRQLYEAPGVLNDKVLKPLIENSGWCFDNVSIQHRHQEFPKSSDQASTSSSSEQPQVQMRVEDADQERSLLCVATVQDLFTNARIRSGLSRADLGKKLKLSTDQVGQYETGKDKRSPKNLILKRMYDLYHLKLSKR